MERTLWRGEAGEAEARSRRRKVGILLAGSDAAAFAAALAVSVAVFAPTGAVSGSAAWLRQEAPALLLIAIGVCAWSGLHRASNRNPMERFRMRARAAMVYMFASALLLMRGEPSAALTVIPMSAVLALVLGVWGEAWLAGLLDRRGMWRLPVAVYGIDARARACAKAFDEHPEWGMLPVRLVAPEEIGGELSVAPTFDILVVPQGAPAPTDAQALRRLGVDGVLLLADTADLPTFGAQVRHLDGAVGIELGAGRRDLEAVKRVADILVCATLGVVALPVLAILAAAIKIADPGPAIYRQRRVGRDGREISVVKLRTMYRDADRRLERLLASDADVKREWESRFKLSKDPRVLPGIGSFLRRSSLDELPQLWNVLAGELSLVGPRPFPQYHLDAFAQDFRRERTSVLPGVTGVWQISCRSDGDLDAQRRHDRFYIRNRSLWLDLYVVIATLPAVLRGRGAE